MKRSREVETSRQLESPRLRVTFHLHADRYAHLVEMRADRRKPFVPVLQSVEGSAEELWPASPPLKQIHLEQRPGGRSVALLVGAAGQSHWSLCAELDPAADWVTLEVACRLQGPPGRLGSCYHIGGDARWDEALGQLRLEAGCLQLRRQAEQPARLELARDAQGGLCKLSIGVQVCAGPWPQTIGWSYAFGVRQ